MSQDNPQPSDAFQQSLDLDAGDFFEPDNEDTELERAVDLLRAESAKALLWGQDRDMQLLDGIIERLERHEHRR